jgi:hypothetical protein
VEIVPLLIVFRPNPVTIPHGDPTMAESKTPGSKPKPAAKKPKAATPKKPAAKKGKK